MCTPTFCLGGGGGGGLNLKPNFQKRGGGGLTRPQRLEGVAEKEGGNFFQGGGGVGGGVH